MAVWNGTVELFWCALLGIEEPQKKITTLTIAAMWHQNYNGKLAIALQCALDYPNPQLSGQAN